MKCGGGRCESTEITGGDIFHVVDVVRSDIEVDTPTSNRVQSGNTSNHLYVDATRGLVIVHPDALITPTRIAEACSCVRKAVLSERVRGMDGGKSGDAAVMGNLKHLFVEVWKCWEQK